MFLCVLVCRRERLVIVRRASQYFCSLIVSLCAGRVSFGLWGMGQAWGGGRVVAPREGREEITAKIIYRACLQLVHNDVSIDRGSKLR